MIDNIGLHKSVRIHASVCESVCPKIVSQLVIPEKAFTFAHLLNYDFYFFFFLFLMTLLLHTVVFIYSTEASACKAAVGLS